MMSNGRLFAMSKSWSNLLQKFFMANGPTILLIVPFYIIFRLFGALQDIISGTIFSQLLSNVIFFASSMWTIFFASFVRAVGGDTQIEGYVNFFRVSYCRPWTKSLWAFFSPYSHTAHATYAMLLIGHNIYNANWYMHPIYLRKYSMLNISRSQENIFFNGFKIVHSTLETLTKVLHITKLSFCK